MLAEGLIGHVPKCLPYIEDIFLGMLLHFLHFWTLVRNIANIKSGEATPAHLNVARQFLRDNNIECLGTNNEDIKSLVEELPFDETPHKEIRTN